VTVPAYFSLHNGRIVSSVYDSVWQPRVARSNTPPIIYMHGASPLAEIPRQMNNTTNESGLRDLLMFLAGEGFTIVCIATPDMWGNATAISRYTSALAYARSTLGCSSDPAVLIGASHGGLCALRYAYTTPADVACVIGIIGVVDMDDVRDNDLSGLRAPIDAAWGVTYPAALPAGANPADNTASYVGKPIQWHYASDDAIARATPITNFASAVGASMSTYNLGALGHTDAAMIAVNEATVLTFIEANT
jgi:pimeloyl-ACP methyl ester carboxylesterase